MSKETSNPENLGKINIIFGKNGCGKSTFLRSLCDKEGWDCNYISPERGGPLKFNANILTRINENKRYLSSERNKNNPINFREQTLAQSQRIENIIGRDEGIEISFKSILNDISTMLPFHRLTPPDEGISGISVSN